jgi:hypothetical protein
VVSISTAAALRFRGCCEQYTCILLQRRAAAVGVASRQDRLTHGFSHSRKFQEGLRTSAEERTFDTLPVTGGIGTNVRSIQLPNVFNMTAAAVRSSSVESSLWGKATADLSDSLSAIAGSYSQFGVRGLIAFVDNRRDAAATG